MSGLLVDTNVISELTRERPDGGVAAFLATQGDLWLSVVVLHELDFGAALLPPGRRRKRIEEMLRALEEEYEDRILPVGRAEAAQASALRSAARQAGRVLDFGDGLIAGTAAARGLAIATRNVGDFEGLGLRVVNPWEAAEEHGR